MVPRIVMLMFIMKILQVNRKLLEYDQRFSELFVDVGRTKEEHGSTSNPSTSTSNWKKDDPAKQFYVNHSLSAPALSSAVFVAANVVSVTTEYEVAFHYLVSVL